MNFDPLFISEFLFCGIDFLKYSFIIILYNPLKLFVKINWSVDILQPEWRYTRIQVYLYTCIRVYVYTIHSLFIFIRISVHIYKFTNLLQIRIYLFIKFIMYTYLYNLHIYTFMKIRINSQSLYLYILYV